METDKAKDFYKKLGKLNSIKMKEFNQTPQGKANIEKNAIDQSKRMREKIANGEFTPNITNT